MSLPPAFGGSAAAASVPPAFGGAPNIPPAFGGSPPPAAGGDDGRQPPMHRGGGHDDRRGGHSERRDRGDRGDRDRSDRGRGDNRGRPPYMGDRRDGAWSAAMQQGGAQGQQPMGGHYNRIDAQRRPPPPPPPMQYRGGRDGHRMGGMGGGPPMGGDRRHMGGFDDGRGHPRDRPRGPRDDRRGGGRRHGRRVDVRGQNFNPRNPRDRAVARGKNWHPHKQASFDFKRVSKNMLHELKRLAEQRWKKMMGVESNTKRPSKDDKPDPMALEATLDAVDAAVAAAGDKKPAKMSEEEEQQLAAAKGLGDVIDKGGEDMVRKAYPGMSKEAAAAVAATLALTQEKEAKEKKRQAALAWARRQVAKEEAMARGEEVSGEEEEEAEGDEAEKEGAEKKEDKQEEGGGAMAEKKDADVDEKMGQKNAKKQGDEGSAGAAAEGAAQEEAAETEEEKVVRELREKKEERRRARAAEEAAQRKQEAEEARKLAEASKSYYSDEEEDEERDASRVITLKEFKGVVRRHDANPSVAIYVLIRLGDPLLADEYMDTVPLITEVLNESIPIMDKWLIHRAVWEGNVPLLKSVIKRGISITGLNGYGEDPETVVRSAVAQNKMPRELALQIIEVLHGRFDADEPALTLPPGLPFDEAAAWLNKREVEERERRRLAEEQRLAMEEMERRAKESRHSSAQRLAEQRAEEEARRTGTPKVTHQMVVDRFYSVYPATDVVVDVANCQWVSQLFRRKSQRHVFVSGISYDAQIEEVLALFELCGEVERFYMPYRYVCGSHGYSRVLALKLGRVMCHGGKAVVLFKYSRGAQAALSMDKHPVRGRPLNVSAQQKKSSRRAKRALAAAAAAENNEDSRPLLDGDELEALAPGAGSKRQRDGSSASAGAGSAKRRKGGDGGRVAGAGSAAKLELKLKDRCCVHVTGVAFEVTTHQLRSVFEQVASVAKIDCPGFKIDGGFVRLKSNSSFNTVLAKKQSAHCGHVVVHFHAHNHAMAALQINGNNLGGRRIEVRLEAPWELKPKKRRKRKKKPRPRKTAGGSGGGPAALAEDDDKARMIKSQLARQWNTGK